MTITAGTGTITSANNLELIIGVGTSFTTQVDIGDAIEFGGDVKIVEDILSNTELIIQTPFVGSQPSASAFNIISGYSVIASTGAEFKSVAADVMNDDIAAAESLTDLSLTVVAGQVYKLNYSLLFSSDTLTSGIELTLTGTGDGDFSLSVSVPNAVDGNGAAYSGVINAIDDYVISPAVAVAGDLYTATIDGVFDCTVSGVITPAFRPEVTAEATVYKGSCLQYKLLS